ncbi:hypothetical protein [Wenjunlia vitaminophila]|uniref:hypothetical protein n=1 Tax=Wenjunlia vitaminophila TaxID=76728 RepID=UPI0003823CF2|nr:hypothetical protein [Wenjunlia vitaminophila]
MPEPIEPSRIIPAGWPLPGSAAGPAAGPPWWRASEPSPPPAGPPHVHLHLDVHITPPRSPAATEPEPGPGWWERHRPGYQAACILAGLPITGAWAAVLDACRTEAGLAGAWVLALGPLTATALADNICRAAAAGADPDLWPPRIRAAVARVALWAAVIATALALPVTTVVYLLTGVSA